MYNELNLRSSDPDDPDIEEDVFNLIKERFDVGDHDVEVFYDHGQWWARVETGDKDHPERTFSVVDCESEVGEQYLDLEEI